MRFVTLSLLATLGLGAANAARAADLDYDYLRGSDYDREPAYAADWSGAYLGGHGGYTSGAFGQRDAGRAALADYFSHRDIESEFNVSTYLSMPGSRARSASYGVFAGFNMQFDDIVVGLEADYTHAAQDTTSRASIGRTMTTAGGMYETVILSGTSNTKIEDYGTVRARAGYAFGNLLPYVTAGLAIGQVAVQDKVSVQNYGYDATAYAANQAGTSGAPVTVSSHGYRSFNQAYPANGSSPAGATQTIPAAPTTLNAATRTRTVGGGAFGFGLEYALTPNILLRGEYQYVVFQSFNGHTADLNTIRGGAAVKF